ncbi:MAG: hypothetical protein M0P97_01200 [Candidatus Moranbacteria bacterium]|jgi:hypothetical protein|nr:hypothetical protein [Candidatus Moranbacteria bacterium]
MEIPNANKYNIVGEKESQPTLAERTFLAKKEARPVVEAEIEDEKSAALINDFINGRIGLQEFNANDLTKSGKIRPGEIELVNLEEMQTFLRDLFHDDAIANELTEHEKEHLDKIVEMGWSARLLFRFFIDDEGSLSGRPGVSPNIPEVGNEDDIRNKLRSIIEAAQEPSDTDELSINNS